MAGAASDDRLKTALPRARDALILRIASAAFLAPLTLMAAWVGGPIFAGLVAFLCVLMAFEWARMTESAETSTVFYTLGAASAAALTLAAAGFYSFAFLAAAAGGAGALVSAKKHRGWAAFGAAFFIAPAIALLWLREEHEAGGGLALLLFAIVWAADTGGYAGGRLVGGPKLNPSISPAKTWAGAAGGLIFGAAAAFFGAPLLLGWPADGFALAVGGGLGLASIVGDMAESAIKRRFGVKDMSGFIPGHGGVLDRLDGMIFATSAMTAALYAHSLIRGAPALGQG
ncbi:MAG: phosphatidate cytidylyltransferase [Parvularculaceae bacterium]|nr:phosphatidate cytidylyltransferase [Parvularculaceae bacterium]